MTARQKKMMMEVGGCFLKGRERPLPGNRDVLTKGFEGFPVISKDFNDY